MRAKTSDFLKVLNRARPEQKTTEKKTITYALIIYVYSCAITIENVSFLVAKLSSEKND